MSRLSFRRIHDTGLEGRGTRLVILQSRTVLVLVCKSHLQAAATNDCHSLPPTGLVFPTWTGCCCFPHSLTACLPSFEPSSAHVVGQRFIAQHARCGTFQARQITLAEWMLGVQGETD